MIRKWIKRFLFVLAVFTLVVWLAAERTFKHYGSASPTRIIMLDFRGGGFILQWVENRSARIPDWHDANRWQGSYKDYVFLSWHSGESGYTHIVLKAKFLFLCTLLAVYPCLSFCFARFRRHRRRKRNQCIRCGYNLTGLLKPRCPECGEAS